MIVNDSNQLPTNPRGREVNYVVPPIVAITDKLPRYKIVPVSESDFGDRGFTKSREDFQLPADDLMDEAQYESLLGTPVYSTLEFPIRNALSEFQPIGDLANQNQGIALRIDMAIVTVTQTKNIVKTVVQGRDGTIKEYIGDGDYMIDIQGAIVSPYPNYYPKDEVEQLLRICKVKNQIPIAGGMFDIYGIAQVVVTDFKIKEMEGSRNVVPFTISALSDGDDYIVINKLNSIW